MNINRNWSSGLAPKYSWKTETFCKMIKKKTVIVLLLVATLIVTGSLLMIREVTGNEVYPQVEANVGFQHMPIFTYLIRLLLYSSKHELRYRKRMNCWINMEATKEGNLNAVLALLMIWNSSPVLLRIRAWII